MKEPLVVEEVVFIEVGKDDNGVPEELPRAWCTCGWKTDQESNLLLLAVAAKAHEMETGHQRRSHE